jgi:DNA-binding transcriptional LysR family regulator
MNWDDLRIISAVKDAGSYAGAGTTLRIDETTVARRLSRIERALGIRLFEAVDGQRRPTSQCEAVLAHVQAMAGEVAAIGKIGAKGAGPTGRFRIASTHTIAEEFLAPRAGEFLTRNTGLALQFLTSSENVKFSRWEADFAIRLRKPEKGDFTISKLGDLALYFIEPATPAAGDPIVCGYPDALDLIPEAQFLKSRGLKPGARCITDNVRVIHGLLQSHGAVGVLPDYLCGDLLRDRRLRLTELKRQREVWLLVQNHLKRDAAARLVIDWIRDGFAELGRG